MVNNILHQTRLNADKDITSPSMAVNPNKITAVCNSIYGRISEDNFTVQICPKIEILKISSMNSIFNLHLHRFIKYNNLSMITMKLKKGNKAPLFSLFDSDKNEVKLESYQGKNVVLLFFPLAFTGVCTAELCSIRDEKEAYASLNAEILGISVDSLFVLEEFKAKEGYNFPLLSDFNKEVSQSYGALYQEFAFGMKGVSKRSAFLIDKKGVIQFAEVLENPTDLPNFIEIKEILNQL